MTRSSRRALTGLAATVLALTALAPIAGAAPPEDGPPPPASQHRPDNRPGPLTARQDALRKAALEKVRAGEAAADQDGVVQVAEDKYAQVEVTGVDQVFTVLAEFGDQGDGRLGTTPGPLHNEIQEPDRRVDNTTLWVDDFSRGYYLDLFFGEGETFADFYAKQSSGAYTVDGDVSEWVQVPGNASTYGDNAVEDYGGVWRFVEDSVNAWYQAQLDAGMTAAEIDAYLSRFDTWDRYDFDGDGSFAEPDGYLDHFQAIHAGEGEEAGGGALGGDAIWSHRWYVNATDFGLTGPTVEGEQILYGGTQVGGSKYWIGDYTTEPENGGLGVFAHEYAHDLGLPDLYDTNAGENGTGFWTLMSSGSWLSNAGAQDIGSTPDHMGPWEKLQLGWLDYAVVSEGESGELALGPAAEQGRRQEQAVIVDVPDQGVTTEYNTPYSGSYEWWSGSADDLNVTLARPLDLTGVRSATVTAQAWYDIEAGYDYLYAETSTDGGETWQQIGQPIDGSSNGRWTTLRWSVPGGQELLFRFRYQTDGGVHLPGAFLDDIAITSGGSQLLFDDVESGDNGWTADGWTRMSGEATSIGDRYYLAEHRSYTGYDATLQHGPYNFSNLYTKPNWVEKFPYQDGLLVWAVDETYTDNNTSQHPGHGLALPVDARPALIRYSDGSRPSNRRQVFDATFGLDATDEVAFHKEVRANNGTVSTVEALVKSSPGIATFSDADPDAYWDSANPQSSALVAGHGATIQVLGVRRGVMTVAVANPASAG
ncbi:MAG TPA: immune inhibitor A domain-containing protein [Acidimicrobiales bacterium]|nr:immune inhibitor A domain-containing protein [Acidimicrobiales bacterium]